MEPLGSVLEKLTQVLGSELPGTITWWPSQQDSIYKFISPKRDFGQLILDGEAIDRFPWGCFTDLSLCSPEEPRENRLAEARASG